MDGLGFVNGWTRVCQWIEQRNSMDEAKRLNGWNMTVQWMDKHLPIWRGKTDMHCGEAKRA